MTIMRLIVCFDCGTQMPDQKYPPKRCESCRRKTNLAVYRRWKRENGDYSRAYRRIYEKYRRGTVTEAELDSWLAEHGRGGARTGKRETAALEASLAGQESRIVRAGVASQLEAGEVGTRERPRSESSFTPDFGKRLKP